MRTFIRGFAISSSANSPGAQTPEPGRKVGLQLIHCLESGSHSKACFTAGTLLWTPEGYRPIEEIQVGDRVYSRDEYDPAAAAEAKVVEEVFRNFAGVYNLHVGRQVIGTTAENPFFEIAKGWTKAVDLRPGDRILCADGSTVAVDAIVETGNWAPVFNLRIADHHTYFVGEDGWGFSVWSHNACFDVGLYRDLPIDAKLPRHHVPQQTIGSYYWPDYDPKEAPAISIPDWMHHQVQHMTKEQFDQIHHGNIRTHIKWHLEQLKSLGVPKESIKELRRMTELYF